MRVRRRQLVRVPRPVELLGRPRVSVKPGRCPSAAGTVRTSSAGGVRVPHEQLAQLGAVPGLLRTRVAHVEPTEVGREATDVGRVAGVGIALGRTGAEPLRPVQAGGRSRRTPTRGQVQSQPGSGCTSTRSVRPRPAHPVAVRHVDAQRRRAAPTRTRTTASGRRPDRRPRPPSPGAPAGRGPGRASARPTTDPGRPRRGSPPGRPSSYDPRSSLRSLSVGARHSSSRGPDTARSPSRVSSPVARSSSAGPSVRVPRPPTGRAPPGDAPERATRAGGRRQVPLGAGDDVTGRGPRGVVRQLGAHGQPGLAARRRGRAARRGGPAGPVSPASTGIASIRTSRPGTPSTSRTPTNRSPAVVAECWRLRTVSVDPRHSRRTGALTALHSARPGVGVPSGRTMPSMTKLPSCTTSPKSPP